MYQWHCWFVAGTKDESGMLVSRYFSKLRLWLRLSVDLGHAELLGYGICRRKGWAVTQCQHQIICDHWSKAMLGLVSTWMGGHCRISSELMERGQWNQIPLISYKCWLQFTKLAEITKHCSLHLPISKSLSKCLPDSSLLTTRGHSGSSANVRKNSGTSLAPPGGELWKFL